MARCPHLRGRTNRGVAGARGLHSYSPAMHDDTLDEDDDDIILLEQPVLDADDLVEDEISEDDIETEQVVLLDMRRLSEPDLELA